MSAQPMLLTKAEQQLIELVRSLDYGEIRIMIKDNHRELAAIEGDGAIARAVERARKAYPSLEIEGILFTMFDGRLNVCQLAHEVGIDVQAACGVDDDHVRALGLSRLDTVIHHRRRVCASAYQRVRLVPSSV